MTRIIRTEHAPAAIGTYSQAVGVGKTVYMSGQIALDPATGQMVTSTIEAEIRRVFDNLVALAQAAGNTLDDVVKMTVYLTDMAHFPQYNQIMAEYFSEPYPARAAVGVASLPRGAHIEVECIISQE